MLSNGMTLPVSILYANEQSGPKQTHCPCCVMGLTAIRGLLTSACRDAIVMSLLSHNRHEFTFHPTQQTCQPSSTVLRLPRPSDVCTLVLLDAGTTFLQPQLGQLTQCCDPSTCYTPNCLANFCSRCRDHPSVCSQFNCCCNLCRNFCSIFGDNPSSCSGIQLFSQMLLSQLL